MPVLYRSAQADEPAGTLHLVENELPEPGPGQVRVSVEAAGICHSDAAMISGRQPGAAFPLVPGHEIVGRIDAIGDSVQGFAPGERVAVGWFGGDCGYCVPCREGDFINCARLQVPGLSYTGGYADAVVVPATALARIPEEFTRRMPPPWAAPA